jgi:hypothetical protein
MHILKELDFAVAGSAKKDTPSSKMQFFALKYFQLIKIMPLKQYFVHSKPSSESSFNIIYYFYLRF